MTHATKAIYRWLLSDYIKVSNISTDSMLYTEADLEASMEKIEVINFHEEKEVGGVRFWAYNAGHVLGAAMYMIEIAGVKILYTGDFSRQEDRHLMAAEIPTVRPDILITVTVPDIVIWTIISIQFVSISHSKASIWSFQFNKVKDSVRQNPGRQVQSIQLWSIKCCETQLCIT